jgi:hypothetical protein
MAKVYEGTFGIRSNTKGEIVLGKTAKGKYTAEDAATVYKKVTALAKEHKLVARVFKPDAKGTEPVILADRWGNPYLALLPKRESAAPAAKRSAWFD